MVTLEQILKDTAKETQIPEETKFTLLEKVLQHIYHWVNNLKNEKGEQS